MVFVQKWRTFARMVHFPEHLPSLAVELAEEEVGREVRDPNRLRKLLFLAAVVRVADGLEVPRLGGDHVDPPDLGKHEGELVPGAEQLDRARDGGRGLGGLQDEAEPREDLHPRPQEGGDLPARRLDGVPGWQCNRHFVWPTFWPEFQIEKATCIQTAQL